MTDKGHTLGPWKIGVARESSVTITDAKTTYVATLMDKPGWGNMAANAALIAAAPETAAERDRLKIVNAALLEACENVVWKLSFNHRGSDYEGPARIDRRDAVVKMAVAAIAKAKGELDEGN